MKRLPFFALLLTLFFSLAINDAEARRLGGGVSSGMKRNGGFMQRSAPPAQAPGAATAPRPAPSAAPATSPPASTAQPSGMRRWLGPLAGLATGLGLAALFSHFGLGEGMGSFILLLLAGAAIFLVVRLLMNRAARTAPTLQPAGFSNDHPQPLQRFEPLMPAPAPGSAEVASNAPHDGHIPADFDRDGFLRQAKLNFIRLQAANDAGNMEDIRTFTSPEMFAEIRMQLQERDKSSQQTDVVQLEATLLDVSQESGRQIASVRFYGLIRETAEGAAASFEEIWHLTRPLDGSTGWGIAGIEQPH